MIKSSRLKMILKFDTGADGFLKMIYVLAGGAILVLICGVCFLIFQFPGILNGRN